MSDFERSGMTFDEPAKRRSPGTFFADLGDPELRVRALEKRSHNVGGNRTLSHTRDKPAPRELFF